MKPLPISFSCSLLIPCRNGARFLPALFAGVRAQRLPFVEILLWDDGSTDETSSIAAEHGARVLRASTAVGPAVARNELVRAATCDWVHLHDADDLILPDYLANLAPHVADDIDIVACDADWIDERTRECVIRWRYSARDYAVASTAYLLTHPLGINNCIYRRSAFLDAGGYDPQVVPWEDADLHIRLAYRGSRFEFVPQVLTQSVRHAGGISMDYRRNWRARVACLQQYSKMMPTWLYPILASEAERAAGELAVLGDPIANVAIQLCREFGGDPPTSHHPTLRLLKPLLPTRWLLKQQRRRRGLGQ